MIRSRRRFLGAGAAALCGVAMAPSTVRRAGAPRHRMRVRAITAGLTLGRGHTSDSAAIENAGALLARARTAFMAAGYEVQTIRIATAPIAIAHPRDADAALARIKALDEAATAREISLSIGPLPGGGGREGHAAWIAELIRATKSTNCTIAVASAGGGVDSAAVLAAAQTIRALSTVAPGGVANFRFAAAAGVPAGSPFFPVAYHQANDDDALSIGLESAGLVEEAFAAAGPADPASRLRAAMNAALAPVEKIAAEFCRRERRAYGGIDPSPAPGMDRSIGAAVEALSGVPFGEARTLTACAAITDALRSLDVRTCGYRGLMLPVLEDPVLSRRAGEGRYGIEELLLYSSVCGTGLDVVPVPGDTPVEVLARIVGDVAALSSRLRKPLSARLFPVPGKAAGELARFDDPLLTETVVFPVS